MKEATMAVESAKKEAPLKMATPEEIFNRMQEVYDHISRRAFEIFELNGKQLGHDLENWLKAEAELLHPLHMDITEADAELKVRAEAPGFTEKNLVINLGPRRLTISGKREAKEALKEGNTIYSELCSDEIFRTYELPVEVDTDKVTATLQDGVLELLLPKVALKKLQVQVKSA